MQSINHSICFPAPAEEICRFVCDSPECEGMRTDCFDCGMQCRECVPVPPHPPTPPLILTWLLPSRCIAKLGPECGACANTVCVKHLSERDSENFSCDHCSTIFCDLCINYLHGQMHLCVVCDDAVCVVSSPPSLSFCRELISGIPFFPVVALLISPLRLRKM